MKDPPAARALLCVFTGGIPEPDLLNIVAAMTAECHQAVLRFDAKP